MLQAAVNVWRKLARTSARHRARARKRGIDRRSIRVETLEPRLLLTGFANYIDVINIGGSGETPIVGDFNGDGYEDIGVYVPDSGGARWAVNGNNGNGTIGGRIYDQYTIGGSGETPIVGDFNGDGYTDIGVYLPNGSTNARWAINKNDRDGSFGGRIYDQYTVGGSGDIPIVGDFNGDGYDDIGVYIPNSSDARWAINLNNRNGTFGGRYIDVHAIGGLGEKPIVGDFNGDGYDDIGVYVPNGSTNARWAINLNNGNGTFGSRYIDVNEIGGVGEVPFAGDFNRDGRDDIGIHIPSTRRWVVKTTPSTGERSYKNTTVVVAPGETVEGDIFGDVSAIDIRNGAIVLGNVSASNGSTVSNDGVIKKKTTVSNSTAEGDGSYDGGLVLEFGLVSPGHSPGILTAGGIDFGQGSTLRIELNGNSVGSGYDQLRVNGTVDLSNATLFASLAYTPVLGQEFVIVNNDGSDAVVSTFSGLPEGASLTIGSQRFHLTYGGGDGNDVVLRRNRAPAGGSGFSSVNEDSLLADNVMRSDLDGDGTTVELVSGPANAATSSFSLDSDGSFSYAPKPDFSGADSFTYRVFDGELYSEHFTYTIDVLPVADAPTLVLADATGNENAPLSLSILSDLADFDGSEVLSLAIAGVPAGSVLNQGADNGGGNWTLSPAQLAGLEITVPDDDSAPFVLTVTATATEVASNGTATTTGTLDVHVNNLAPALAVAADQAAIEGNALSLTNLGAFSDSGITNPDGGTVETFSYSIAWGDGTSPDLGTATVDAVGVLGGTTIGSFDGSHIYADNGAYTVTVAVSDDDGGSDTETFQVVVNNASPMVLFAGSNLNIGSQSDVSGVRGQTLYFDGSFADPGFDNSANPNGASVESFTYNINWGDSTSDVTGTAVIENAGDRGVPTEGTFGGSHIYASEGTYSITVTLTDDDAGATPVVRTATVGVIAMQGAGDLAVGGSIGRDKIHASMGSSAENVDVVFDGTSIGMFQPTGRLLVFGQAGDDQIQVDGGLIMPTRLYGDAGDDRIKGGAGDDVILGGSGDDLLIGGSGRDLLVGGPGADRLIGNAHDDILVAGYTIYDYDLYGRLRRNHDAAFSSIMDEWTSGGDFLTRIAHLNGVTLGGQNGGYLLSRSQGTVLADADKDVLTGSSGEDWFLFDASLDRATDLQDEVFANDLEFITE